ncbi:helix-turn-helix domain-containing protein [Budvicia diplopodorum]|uniref:helix-turn-helix domain-containing protein n=1 Tax=Budvicia diplopodorum TaxID=1119056 RepID=UPI00135BA7C7|nr:helix-turn-helix domain-containing protein [Budvicia diplopodorum]
MRILQSNDFFQSEQHAFCVFMLNKQMMENAHGHDFDEIVIVRDGSGFHIINDCVEFIYKGDFFFISVNDTHSYLSINNLSIINLLIHKEREFNFINNVERLLALLREAQGNLPLRDMTLSCNELLAITQQCEFISNKNDDKYDDIYFSATESAVLSILGTLCQNLYQKCDRQVFEHASRQYLINFLKHNYMHNVCWNQLCDESGIARRTMFRFIKDVTGFTPGQFQQVFRLMKAQELLRTTDKSISDIAINCGFANSSRLTESYNRQFRHTPTQERRICR